MEPSAIFDLEIFEKHVGKVPRTLSLETEVKISLWTSGKSSNFRPDFFVNAMVSLKKNR